MTIYISGPISGLYEYNRQAFANCADTLLKMGHRPVNPHDVTQGLPESVSGWNDLTDNQQWLYYMREDLKAMLGCDAICMLPGWEGSRGATIEKNLAEQIGISIMAIYPDSTFSYLKCQQS